MEKYKGIVPDDILHVITKGKTCELCVMDKNLSNYMKFSDFLIANLRADLHYCYVVHCELDDGGLFVLSGGFKFPNMDEDDIEMIYNHLINNFLNNYSENNTVNFVNVSFHPYNSIVLLKGIKSDIGL
jgi:hypothetical protein